MDVQPFPRRPVRKEAPLRVVLPTGVAPVRKECKAAAGYPRRTFVIQNLYI